MEQRGIHPVKQVGGRLAYLCPLPDHNESKPSFYVFTNAEFENFYCFGCQAKYTIIDLLSRLENISWKDALDRLAEGVEITREEDSKFQVNKGQKDFDGQELKMGLSDSMMLLSAHCRHYLNSVDLDETECGIIDQFWQQIDQEIASFEYEFISTYTTDMRNILKKRRIKFEQMKREKLRKQMINDC